MSRVLPHARSRVVRPADGEPVRRDRRPFSLATAAVWLIAASFIGMGMSRCRQDNSPEVWFPGDDPAVVRWRAHGERLGPDEALVFLGDRLSAFDSADWVRQQQLGESLGALAGVAEVWTLPRVLRLLGEDPGRPPDGALRDLLRSSPAVRPWLLAGDGDHPVVVARVRPGDGEGRARLVAAADQCAARFGGWTLVGPTWFNVELDRLARGDTTLIVAAMLLVLLIGGRLVTGSGRMGVLVAFSAVVPICIWVALLGWLLLPLSAVQSTVFPLLAIVGMENALHIRSLLAENRRAGAHGCSETEPRAVVARAGRPLLLANLTTAASLAGLGLMRLSMVRALGATLPFAVMASWCWSRWVLPDWMDEVARGGGDGEMVGWLARQAHRMAAWGIRRPVPVTGALAALLVLGAVVLPHLDAEANISLQLDPSTRLARHVALAEDLQGGSVPASLELSISGGRTMLPAGAVAAASRALRAVPGVAAVVGDADRAELLTLARRAPDSSASAAMRHALGLATPALPDLARIEVLMRDGPSESLLARLAEMEQAVGRALAEAGIAVGREPDAVRIEATGTVPLLLRAQRDILRDQLTGLLASLALVLLLVLLLSGLPLLALLALPLNLAPVAAVLVGAVLLGWPVDLMSVQLGSLLFGYVVNSTIYVGVAAFATPGGPAELRRVVRRAGPAVLGAAALAAAVFACTALSRLVSLRHLAVLAPAALATAAWADLCALPAFLALRRPGA